MEFDNANRESIPPGHFTVSGAGDVVTKALLEAVPRMSRGLTIDDVLDRGIRGGASHAQT
jgi:hypothetical protein